MQNSKSLELFVESKDNVGLAKVEYLLDGKVAVRSIEPPFRVTISLTNLAHGEHTIQAIAYDAAGNTGKSKVFTFTIESDEVKPANEESRQVDDVRLFSSALTQAEIQALMQQPVAIP